MFAHLGVLWPLSAAWARATGKQTTTVVYYNTTDRAVSSPNNTHSIPSEKHDFKGMCTRGYYISILLNGVLLLLFCQESRIYSVTVIALISCTTSTPKTLTLIIYMNISGPVCADTLQLSALTVLRKLYPEMEIKQLWEPSSTPLHTSFNNTADCSHSYDFNLTKLFSSVILYFHCNYCEHDVNRNLMATKIHSQT